MEESLKKKYFVQLQFCILLAACTLLPDFEEIVTSMLGVNSGLDTPVLIARIIGLAGAGWTLSCFYNSLKDKMPTPYLCIIGGGLVLTLIATIASDYDWVGYIALILLFIALYMGKQSLNIVWNQTSTQGAYLIMFAVLLHVYYNIDDKISTAIAAFVGLVMYLIALGKFSQSLDAPGKSGVSKLKIAVWIGLVASGIKFILGWIPFIGFVVGILVGLINIVAFVFEYIGYGNLKKSVSLHSVGQDGAGKLRASMILNIVACIFGMIPLLGWIGGIIAIIALWFVYRGWTMIQEGLEQTEVAQSEE